VPYRVGVRGRTRLNSSLGFLAVAAALNCDVVALEPWSHPGQVPAGSRGFPQTLAREWHGPSSQNTLGRGEALECLSRRQSATMAGAPTDQACVCQGTRYRASATLLGNVRQSNSRRRKRGDEAVDNVFLIASCLGARRLG
jgi:hypothetical protein